MLNQLQAAQAPADQIKLYPAAGGIVPTAERQKSTRAGMVANKGGKEFYQSHQYLL